jgi:hypothetical protein
VQPNPPWVTRSLRQAWDALERLVGPGLMPLMTATDTRDRAAPREFGSGHYGTVMPTHTKGIVMKVTSDPTEAALVASALSIGEFPDGIVRYERIVSLPEKLRGRGVFVLWREEAESVGVHPAGFRGRLDNLEYLDEEAMDLIYLFKSIAAALREQSDRISPAAVAEREPEMDEPDPFHLAQAVIAAVMRQRRRQVMPQAVDESLRKELRSRAPGGALRTAVLYSAIEHCLDMMENTNGILLVGEALRFYFDHGILLADVHADNIGRVQRDDHSGLVNAITDPGHAVFLDDRYDKVVIPPLDVAIAANVGSPVSFTREELLVLATLHDGVLAQSKSVAKLLDRAFRAGYVRFKSRYVQSGFVLTSAGHEAIAAAQRQMR